MNRGNFAWLHGHQRRPGIQWGWMERDVDATRDQKRWIWVRGGLRRVRRKLSRRKQVGRGDDDVIREVDRSGSIGSLRGIGWSRMDRSGLGTLTIIRKRRFRSSLRIIFRFTFPLYIHWSKRLFFSVAQKCVVSNALRCNRNSRCLHSTDEKDVHERELTDSHSQAVQQYPQNQCRYPKVVEQMNALQLVSPNSDHALESRSRPHKRKNEVFDRLEICFRSLSAVVISKHSNLTRSSLISTLYRIHKE